MFYQWAAKKHGHGECQQGNNTAQQKVIWIKQTRCRKKEREKKPTTIYCDEIGSYI